LKQKLVQLAGVSTAGVAGFSLICLYKGDGQFYRERFLPTLFKFISGEKAHNLTVWAAKNNLLPRYPILQSVSDLVSLFFHPYFKLLSQ